MICKFHGIILINKKSKKPDIVMVQLHFIGNQIIFLLRSSEMMKNLVSLSRFTRILLYQYKISMTHGFIGFSLKVA